MSWITIVWSMNAAACLMQCEKPPCFTAWRFLLSLNRQTRLRSGVETRSRHEFLAAGLYAHRSADCKRALGFE